MEKPLEELECAFCWLKFAGFKELAEHVTLAHLAPEERPQVQNWEGDDYWRNAGENEMLPAPGAGKSETQRGNVGGQASIRKPPNVPFIKVEDLSGETVTAKILGVQTTGTGFNDIIVKISVSGRNFFLGLKASNENYEKLFNGFGPDEKKWIGEHFSIGLNYNEFYEKNFVHIFDAPAPNEKSGGKKSK